MTAGPPQTHPGGTAGGTRRSAAPWARERGSAVVEFIALAVVLLVPLVYLVLLVARLQAASYAVSVAAREAGRAFVTATQAANPEVSARSAARLAFEDQGFDAPGEVTFDCAASPCLTPDAQVTAHARLRVPLPLVPDVVSDAVPLTVPVEATYVTTVERFGPR